MKIAIAQLNYTVGDIDGNTSKIIDSITRAKGLGADLVLFAEQAVSGTPAFDLLRKTTFLELCEDALVQIASCCDDIAAIVGLPILTAEGTISAAALIQDRKVLRYVGKKYITARREMGFVVPSKGYEYVTIKGHKCAIVVGDDLRRIHDCDSSVETILSINARRYGRGTMTRRYEMMRDLAFVEGKNLVMANQVGGNTEIVYDGTSGAINRRGELCLMMKSFEEDLAVFDTEAPAAPVAVPSSGDRTRLEFTIPSRGIIGLRSNMLTATAGEAIMTHRLKDFEPWVGDIEMRTNGSIIASETGTAYAYSIDKLQDRGRFFISPMDQVYCGQVVGEHTRSNDITVNVTKAKQLTNMRASGSDDKASIAPPIVFSLEEALEYIKEDEYVELTPKAMRLRKILLSEVDRKRAAK